MMSFEFQRQDACLQRIMIERYGGTEFDCPKCGEYSKAGTVCQHSLQQSERRWSPWFYAS